MKSLSLIPRPHHRRSLVYNIALYRSTSRRNISKCTANTQHTTFGAVRFFRKKSLMLTIHQGKKKSKNCNIVIITFLTNEISTQSSKSDMIMLQ